MQEGHNRRRLERVRDSESGLGLLFRAEPGKPFSADDRFAFACCFVGIRDTSDVGMMLETEESFVSGTPLIIHHHDFQNGAWRPLSGVVVWCKQIRLNYYWVGIELRQDASSPFLTLPFPSQSTLQTVQHLPFLLRTNLFKAVPQNGLWTLLNNIVECRFHAGERIFSKEDDGDCFYLIEEGRCRVHCLKNDLPYQIALLGPHDVVGEMAVLTGEARLAHVDAESATVMWKLDREKFDQLVEMHPDLRLLLTELVTKRFETSGHFADKVIGKYAIRHKLGHGAWSIVFHGEHLQLKKAVAIKMLKHNMAMEPEFQEKFSREAEIIARMNHPNVVQVYDIEYRYNTMFIIMEFLEGETLESRLQRTGSLPFSVVAHYLAQVCAALAYAHDHGIIHQDIKPGNLFIGVDDQLKVLDFGLACSSGSENIEMEGTLLYMAPEQIDSEPVDARTDIYSLGITAYEMVAGRRPYPEDDLGRLMGLHIEEDIPDPAHVVPGIPDGLRSFILQACSRKPDDRYQSMVEAMAALAPLCQSDASTARQQPFPMQHMSSFHFFYCDEQKKAMHRLFEEFHSRARELGVVAQMADFEKFKE